MKSGEEVEEQFEVDPLGLDLPHFLLEDVPNPGVQGMLSQVLHLLEILDLQRLQVFLIQPSKQLFEILHLFQSIRLNSTNFIFFQLTPVTHPFT